MRVEVPQDSRLTPQCSRVSRFLIYAVAAVGCGLAVGANSPDHPWPFGPELTAEGLMTLLAAVAMAGVLYVLQQTSPSQGEDRP